MSDLDSEPLDLHSEDDLNAPLEAEVTDTLEADLLEADLDVLEDVEDIDDLEEQLEATGDIDASQLNQNLEVDDEDDEYEEEDDEDESAAQKFLREKLPALSGLLNKFKKKKSAADEDEDLDETKTEIDPDMPLPKKGKKSLVSLIGEKVPALKGALAKLNKKGKTSEDEDEDFDADDVSPIKYAEDEEDQPPKRKIKVIHILILGILVIGVFFEDIFPPEAPPPQVKLKPRYKTAKKAAKTEEKKTDTPSQKEGEEKNRTAEQIKEVGTTSKDSLTSDTELPVANNEDPKPEKVVEQKNEEVKPTTDANNDLDDLFDNKASEAELEQPEETTPDVSEVDAFQEGKEEDTIAVSGTGQVDPGLPMNDGQVTDQVIDGSIDKDITKSILQDLEVKIQADKKEEKLIGNVKPTDAPTYEINGRGLVYSCNGKHWACIDSISFKTCEQNYAWNSSQGKKVECYPVKIFDVEEDCERQQQVNIDNIAETDFCNL